MDRFQAMSAYRAVVEESGFGRAAKRLGVSAAAVSRIVAELERHLGTRLLHRTTRAVSTTEEGQAYYARCVQILDQVYETETSLQEARGIPSGTLRVTVSPALAATTLAPLLAPYHAKYPQVRVEVCIDDRVVDIVREGFDLALRLFMGAMPNSSLIARPLTTFYEHMVASPRYLDARGRPQAAAELAHHAVLGGAMLRTASSPLDLHGPDGPEMVRVSGPVGSDSSLVLRAAALDHLGIALVPEYAVREDVRTGVLERVLPHYRSHPLKLCAVYPPSATLAARLRTFVDHLTEHLAGPRGADRDGRRP